MAAPPVLDRAGAWLAKALRSRARAGTAPIEFHPQMPFSWGGGLGNQPSQHTLLRESIGIPDVATRAIASRVASLNPQVKVRRRREAGTVKDEILDDHVLKLLLDKPHPNLSRSQLFRLTTQWIVTAGEGHWLKVGNHLGVPAELHPIPPPVRPVLRGGVVTHYEVTTGNGSRVLLPADTVIRFYFPDPEAWWQSEGYLGPVGLTADAMKFAGQTLRSHFEKDGTPKTVLEASADATQFSKEAQAAFRALWQQQFNSRRGADVGTPFVTPTGYKLVQLEMPGVGDVVPLLEFWRDDQLLSFGTPRSVLGQVLSGDRSSAETNEWVFDKFTVSPIATMIAETLTLQLAPDFDASIFVAFEPFVSDDKEFALKREAQDVRLGIRTINMVREDRDDDPVPWGNKPLIESKLGVFDPDAPPKAKVPPGPDGDSDDPEDPDAADETDEDERARNAARRRRARSRRARRVA